MTHVHATHPTTGESFKLTYQDPDQARLYALHLLSEGWAAEVEESTSRPASFDLIVGFEA